MSFYRKKQRVVLRGKVRRERWSRARVIASGFLKASVLAAVVYGAYRGMDRFLFHSDRFAVAEVEARPAEGPWALRVKEEASSLKGKSLIGANFKKWGRALKARHPELGSVSVTRSFPDKILVTYGLRTPVAWAVRENGGGPGQIPEPGGTDREALDWEGVRFKVGGPEAGIHGDLPALLYRSTETLRPALSFLKEWSEASSGLEMSLSTAALKKVAPDETGEIVLYVADPSRPGSVVKVAWGVYEPGTFSQKFGRFQDVWSDLGRKSMSAQYINLREVPQKNASVLGDSEIVGRVFVRTLEEPR